MTAVTPSATAHFPYDRPVLKRPRQHTTSRRHTRLSTAEQRMRPAVVGGSRDPGSVALATLEVAHRSRTRERRTQILCRQQPHSIQSMKRRNLLHIVFITTT